jgi:predicted dehydrogenase
VALIPGTVTLSQAAINNQNREPTVTSEIIKLGLVGCGRISQAAHLPALAKARNARLSSVCDTSHILSERVGLQYNVPSYTRLADLLSSDADAVIVAVPDRLHVSVAMEALEAGKHVLIEKPVAESIADGERLLAAVSRLGLKLQVGNMKRHDPGVQFAASAVAQGEIGTILSATCWYRLMSSLRRPVEATLFPAMVVDETVRERELALKQANRTKHLLGTHGVHTFDLMRYLLGDFCVSGAALATDGTDYSWHGTARLERGGIASFEVTASVHAEWSEGFEIYGSRGHVSIRLPYAFLREASTVKLFDEHALQYRVPVFGDTDCYKLQIEAFANSIISGTPTNPDAREGIAALAIVDMIHKFVARAVGN